MNGIVCSLCIAAILLIAWQLELPQRNQIMGAVPLVLAQETSLPATIAETRIPELQWQQIERQTSAEESGSSYHSLITERAKVPGGWLVRSRTYVSEEKSFAIPTQRQPIGGGSGGMGIGIGTGVGLTFVPDPKHEWGLTDP